MAESVPSKLYNVPCTLEALILQEWKQTGEAVQVHEHFHRGMLGALAAEVKAEPLKGELTVVVEGADTSEGASAVDDTASREHLEELIRAGFSPSQAAKMVSKLLSLPKGRVYDMAVRIAAQGE